MYLFHSEKLPIKSFYLTTTKYILLVIFLAILLGGSFLLWQRYYPVVAAKNWQYKVLHNNLEKVSAIYKKPDGSLIVAEELSKQQGRISHIDNNNQRTVLFDNLDKPDGIIELEDGIVFSQEAGHYPVNYLNLENNKLSPLFKGTNVQGLLVNGNNLYAVEDRGKKSQILRYNLTTKKLDIIRSNLKEAETLAICPDGKKYYNEKGKNYVRLLTQDRTDPIILDSSKTRNPSILQCDQRGLWISEDNSNNSRLLLLKPNGKLKVILSHLRAPQQLLQISQDKYLLAEGGRDRILELEKVN